MHNRLACKIYQFMQFDLNNLIFSCIKVTGHFFFIKQLLLDLRCLGRISNFFNVLYTGKFGSTAINCPRSLQILHCQRMLFCTLQRIYSSVATLSSSFFKKSLQFWRGLCCSMQTSNFRLCKRICCDCKTLIAQFKKSEDCCNFGF